MNDERGPGMARAILLIVALILVAGLAYVMIARSGEPAETTYEADAVDQSGGEFIVTDPNEAGVAVDLPETEMTNVPAGQEPAEEPAPPPSE